MGGIHMDHFDPHVLTKCTHDLIGFIQPQQTMIDRD
jgi:hypothetical protein